MAQKAYIASVEIEIIVVAESEESAQRLAAKAFQEEQVREGDFVLGPLSHIPATYYDLQDNVAHDGKGDLTVKEALQLPGGYNANK